MVHLQLGTTAHSPLPAPSSHPLPLRTSFIQLVSQKDGRVVCLFLFARLHRRCCAAGDKVEEVNEPHEHDEHQGECHHVVHRPDRNREHKAVGVGLRGVSDGGCIVIIAHNT